MASGRNLTVYLTSDVSKFAKGLRQGESSLKKFGKAVGIGAAAVGALAVKMGTDAVQAAIEQQKANVKLAKSLDNLGLGEATDAVLEQIDAMQRATGISEDDLMPAFSRLAGVTHNTSTAFALLQAAMDTSVALGKPLETVTLAIAKAAGGQATALSRLIPGLDKTALKGADAATVMKLLNKQFGGQAAANADTMAGKMDRLGIALGEVQESAGTGFLEAFVGPDINEAMDNVQGMEQDARLLGEAIGNLANDTLTAAANFAIGLQAIPTVFGEWVNQVSGVPVEVMDALGLISDQKGAAIRAAREQATARNNMALSGIVNGNDFSNGATNGGGTLNESSRWGSFYSQGSTPSSTDPVRYRKRALDADGRAAARAATSRARP